jgi:hypothetical protein
MHRPYNARTKGLLKCMPYIWYIQYDGDSNNAWWPTWETKKYDKQDQQGKAALNERNAKVTERGLSLSSRTGIKSGTVTDEEIESVTTLGERHNEHDTMQKLKLLN